MNCCFFLPDTQLSRRYQIHCDFRGLFGGCRQVTLLLASLCLWVLGRPDAIFYFKKEMGEFGMWNAELWFFKEVLAKAEIIL